MAPGHYNSRMGQPGTLAEFIAAIREGLVCDRCGKYVGSLAERRYVPPPYPIALGKITAEDEVEALVGFEWHMLNRMRGGNFTIRHPDVEGHCATYREWIEHDDGDEVEPE